MDVHLLRFYLDLGGLFFIFDKTSVIDAGFALLACGADKLDHVTNQAGARLCVT